MTPTDSSGYAPVTEAGAPDAAPTPTYAPANIEHIVGAALVDGVPNLAPVARSVTDPFDQGDSDCPGEGYARYSIELYDPIGCTAQSGARYEGAGALVIGFEDQDEDGRARRPSSASSR